MRRILGAVLVAITALGAAGPSQAAAGDQGVLVKEPGPRVEDVLDVPNDDGPCLVSANVAGVRVCA